MTFDEESGSEYLEFESSDGEVLDGTLGNDFEESYSDEERERKAKKRQKNNKKQAKAMTLGIPKSFNVVTSPEESNGVEPPKRKRGRPRKNPLPQQQLDSNVVNLSSTSSSPLHDTSSSMNSLSSISTPMSSPSSPLSMSLSPSPSVGEFSTLLNGLGMGDTSAYSTSSSSISSLVAQPVPVKRGRGRPRKNPLPQQQLQTLQTFSSSPTSFPMSDSSLFTDYLHAKLSSLSANGSMLPGFSFNNSSSSQKCPKLPSDYEIAKFIKDTLNANETTTMYFFPQPKLTVDEVRVRLEQHFGVDFSCRRMYISEVYDVLCF